MSSKYSPLTNYLVQCGKDELTLTFDEVEQILGFKLPDSLRDYRTNWANSETLSFPLAWLRAGYKTHDVDMYRGIVNFTKTGTALRFIKTSGARKEKNEERLHPEMSQKDEIILHLSERGTMTHGELSIAMYGDNRHMPNLYVSLQSLVSSGIVVRMGDHPSFYSLSGQEAVVPERRKPIRRYVHRQRKREDVPDPSADEVNHWLAAWNKLEDYESQERAINRVFSDYSSNDNLENILIKCSILNDFYSTNIFKIFPVAKHILSLNIDERLKAFDPTLVDDIAKNDVGGKSKNFYSFASKYCSHHNQFEFPIYDSYVDKVLRYFQKVDGFSNFEANDLKNYPKFKNILIEFRKFYGLEQFNLKELDKFLWQFGKRYFPKKY